MCKRAAFVGLCVSPQALLAHVCRLMNSLSVCWDAVTRTLKCYLLWASHSSNKTLSFPSTQIKAENLPAEAGSKEDCGTKTCTRCHSFNLIKVCHFLLLTRSYLQPETEQSRYQEVARVVTVFGSFQLNPLKLNYVTLFALSLAFLCLRKADFLRNNSFSYINIFTNSRL